MTDFTHLLLTRFNVREWEHETIALDPDWLDSRVELFLKHTLPSIQKQSCKNFKWIILFDKETPLKYHNMEPLWRSMAGCELHFEYIGFYLSLESLLHNVAYKYIDANSKYLITSRVDSDDALSPRYMEMVQKGVDFGIGTAYWTFSNGVQRFIKNGVDYNVVYKSNHFLTYVESTDENFKTVLATNHTTVEETGTLMELPCESPMWIEVVHGGNIMNNYTPAYQYMGPMSVTAWLNLQLMRVRFLFDRIKNFLKRGYGHR